LFIGITGLNCSGKDTLAEFLENKGFVKRSLSDEIRKEMKIRGIPITNRESMIELANELRKTQGAGILVKRLVASIDKTKNYSFVSIRNPEEIAELKKHREFFLVFLESDPAKRFERMQERAKHGASQWGKIPQSFDEFLAEEKMELQNKDSTAQQLLQVRGMADIILENNDSVEELFAKVETFLDKLHFVYRRPSWDEYFLDLSRVVAKRATCDRGRSGCVIVKDKHILTTGYVGSPPGLPHCDEVGHLMKQVVDEDGRAHYHCLRTTHAETNAIAQAAKLGVSLNGATMYCKMTPCSTCAKLIISVGIARVVCEKKYHSGKESEDMFQKAGVHFECVSNELEQYKNQ